MIIGIVVGALLFTALAGVLFQFIPVCFLAPLDREGSARLFATD